MLRAADLQLVVVGLAVGIAVPIVAAVLRRRVPQIGVVEVGLGAAAAVALDRSVTGDLPSPLVERGWGLVAAAVVVGLAGRGAGCLPASGWRVPLLLPVVFVQVLGVWAGVPETSAALLVGGLVAGALLLATAWGTRVTPGGAYGLVALPVAATLVGAVGEPIPTVGGLLVSGILVLTGVLVVSGVAVGGVRVGGVEVGGVQVSGWRLGAVVLAVQLGLSVTASRLVAGASDWAGAAPGLVMATGFAALGAGLLAGRAQRSA